MKMQFNDIKSRAYLQKGLLKANNKYMGAVSNILTFDRVTSITMCDLLLINVYLPCKDGSINALHLLHETFANVIDVIEDSNPDYIIFGGDMNVDLISITPHSLVVNDFLETYKIVVDKLLNMNNVGVASIDTQYTFSNTKLNRYSTIDLFVCFKKVETIFFNL